MAKTASKLVEEEFGGLFGLWSCSLGSRGKYSGSRAKFPQTLAWEGNELVSSSRNQSSSASTGAPKVVAESAVRCELSKTNRTLRAIR